VGPEKREGNSLGPRRRGEGELSQGEIVIQKKLEKGGKFAITSHNKGWVKQQEMATRQRAYRSPQQWLGNKEKAKPLTVSDRETSMDSRPRNIGVLGERGQTVRNVESGQQEGRKKKGGILSTCN